MTPREALRHDENLTPLGVRDAQEDPKRTYVGHKGWVGVHLDVPTFEWDEMNDLIEDSYRLIAPKRLSARLDER